VANKKRGRKTLTRQGIIRPEDTGETLTDIQKRIGRRRQAPSASKPNLKPTLIYLARDSIEVAERVFQWRRFGRNLIPSDDHILTLARAIRQTRGPLAPILVFPVVGRFYVVDGHHRLAAYDTAGWRKDIPAYVFEGTLYEARLRALAVNSKDKLPMTRGDKINAAWTIVKEGNPEVSIADTMSLSGVAKGTVNTMRATWKKLNDGNHGTPEELETLFWSQAILRAKGLREEMDRDVWVETEADKLLEDIVRAKLGTRLTKNPDITARALEKLNDTLPSALIEEWREEYMPRPFDPHDTEGDLDF
jgi:hypothetical protein